MCGREGERGGEGEGGEPVATIAASHTAEPVSKNSNGWRSTSTSAIYSLIHAHLDCCRIQHTLLQYIVDICDVTTRLYHVISLRSMSGGDNQLFVGRLPRGSRSRELEDVFYKYGKMTRCDVKQGEAY